jgi:proton-dependent oligopeptide transporter, POT family
MAPQPFAGAKPMTPGPARARHPAGLPYLFLTEAWERFSYYGMTSLVVLYMVQRLLLPANLVHVAGLSAFRALLQGGGPPLTPRALASEIFGFYTAFVYLTPLLGGLLADRLLGVRRTVMLGALLLSAGHFAMAFDRSFLLALVLLMGGTGCMKGNITAQVGTLYPPENSETRTRGYVIFYAGINIGATIGPLVCSTLAQLYGWHAGFGLAGALMLLSLVTYLAGLRRFPPDPPLRRHRAPTPPLTAQDKRRVLALLPVVGITIFQTIAYYQCFNVGQMWISEHVALDTPLGRIPAPWFNSVDALVQVLTTPLLLSFWAWQEARGREPATMGKIGRGALLCTLCSLLLYAGASAAGEARVSALVPLVAIAGMGLALNFYWPPTLALVSRVAPASLRSTMMGVAYLSYFLANLTKGWLGTFYEPLGPARFWLMNSGVAALGVVLVLAFGRALSRRLGEDTPAPPVQAASVTP